MSAQFTPRGHDGKSADLPSKPSIPESPVISKAPFLSSATGSCGICGTSMPLVGRPGTTHDHFTCRSCNAINHANDGRGFTFLGWN